MFRMTLRAVATQDCGAGGVKFSLPTTWNLTLSLATSDRQERPISTSHQLGAETWTRRVQHHGRLS